MEAVEFFADGASDAVDAAAAEGVRPEHRRKVDGVEPVAGRVDEASEAHAFATYRRRVFERDHVSDDLHVPSHPRSELPRGYTALPRRPGFSSQQVERWREGKAQQL